MPFDFDDYQKKCNGMTIEELDKEWDNYTRQITAGSTSTATSVLLCPFTGGVSLVGLGLAAPRIYNARQKREIIEASLQAQGTTHHTQVWADVIAPMAVVGALGGLSLGLVPGADMIPTTGGAGHAALDYAATHMAGSATGALVKYEANEIAKWKAEEISEQEIPTSYVEGERFGTVAPPVVHHYSTFSHPENPQLQIGQTPNPGIQSSQSWPQDNVIREKFGIVSSPVVHRYSMFSHPEDPQHQTGQTPNPGIQSSQSWPEDNVIREKFGIVSSPVVHPYFMFSHPEGSQQQVVQRPVENQKPEPAVLLAEMTPDLPSVFSPFVSDKAPDKLPLLSQEVDSNAPALENDRDINVVRSVSVLVSTSKTANSQIQITQAQLYSQVDQTFEDQTIQSKAYPQALPPSQTSQELNPEPDINTVTENDDLVSTLTLEEETLILKIHLVQLEIEKRRVQMEKQKAETEKSNTKIHNTTEVHNTAPSPTHAGIHRADHVHRSKSERPHLHAPAEHAARRSSERNQIHQDQITATHLSSPSLQEQGHLPQPTSGLSTSSPNLPAKSDVSQTSSLSSTRSPSLPTRPYLSQTPSLPSMNQDIHSSSIVRKPLPTQLTSPQSHQPQLKDQRHDSGYYSTASTPSISEFPAVIQHPAPHILPPAIDYSRDLAGQEQGHNSSQLSLSPEFQFLPSYCEPPLIAGGLGNAKDYFNKDAAPNTTVQYPANLTSSSVQSLWSNALKIDGWQWETALAKPETVDENTGNAVEPDYGPPPPIPARQ